MNKTAQISTVLSEKYGKPVYKSNPSIPFEYEWEEINKEHFVNLYLIGAEQFVRLSRAALAVFVLVCQQVIENSGKDTVLLDVLSSGIEARTYQRGLRELLAKEFLFRSTNPGLFFVNIRFMFNGDRLAFIKGYRLKGSALSNIY